MPRSAKTDPCSQGARVSKRPRAKCFSLWERQKTGGVAAHQENIAKPPLKAQTGWSVQNDHPVRAFLTFDGAATPPVPGGEYLPLQRMFRLQFRARLGAGVLGWRGLWSLSRASQQGRGKDKRGGLAN